MFEKKAEPAPVKPATPEVKPADLGIVIHVMPKEFYGKEASLKDAPKPVAPTPPPAPVVPPPTPKPVPPKKKSALPVILVVVGLLLMGGLGIAAYLLTREPVEVVDVTPAPEPEPMPVPEPKPKPEPEPVVPEPSKDTDSDGLTDLEEYLYGTEFRNPDTDGDTFLDGNEVFHRYDPKGTAPSTLLDTGSVKVYSSETLPFTMYYPASWRVTESLPAKKATFKTPNTATMVVAWEEKSPLVTLEAWLLENREGIAEREMTPSYTKEGYYTVQGEDDFVTYIDLEDTVYIVTYNLGEETQIAYLQTYEMMVNSFKKTP